MKRIAGILLLACLFIMGHPGHQYGLSSQIEGIWEGRMEILDSAAVVKLTLIIKKRNAEYFYYIWDSMGMQDYTLVENISNYNDTLNFEYNIPNGSGGILNIVITLRLEDGSLVGSWSGDESVNGADNHSGSITLHRKAE